MRDLDPRPVAPAAAAAARVFRPCVVEWNSRTAWSACRKRQGAAASADRLFINFGSSFTSSSRGKLLSHGDYKMCRFVNFRACILMLFTLLHCVQMVPSALAL